MMWCLGDCWGPGLTRSALQRNRLVIPRPTIVVPVLVLVAMMVSDDGGGRFQ